ncbi:hypothetical protein COB64_03990 [Candidatus Wolfebacteria bacterium]|nr:MAG: hypothetical protein COB64_03990 [Candidatus Wolfebacteria bacterium]
MTLDFTNKGNVCQELILTFPASFAIFWRSLLNLWQIFWTLGTTIPDKDFKKMLQSLLEEIRDILRGYDKSVEEDLLKWSQSEIDTLKYVICEVVDDNITPTRSRAVIFRSEQKQEKNVAIEGLIGNVKLRRGEYEGKPLRDWISNNTLLDVINVVKGKHIQKFTPSTLDLLALAACYEGWQGYKAGKKLSGLKHLYVDVEKQKNLGGKSHAGDIEKEDKEKQNATHSEIGEVEPVEQIGDETSKMFLGWKALIAAIVLTVSTILWQIFDVSERLKLLEIDEAANESYYNEISMDWWQSIDDDWKKLFTDKAEMHQPVDSNELKKIWKKIGGVDCHGYGIKNLTPLTALTWITYVNCGGKKDITNLEPLSHLKKLERLIIDSTSVSDLSALDSLSSIEYLRCVHTKLDQEDFDKFKERHPKAKINYSFYF